MNYDVLHEQEITARQMLREHLFEHWWREEVFSLNWWLLLACSVLIVWVVWKRLDRGRLFELLTYASIVCIISTILDASGTNAVLWSYPYKLVPVEPPIIPLDLIMMPGVFVMVYQYTSRWSTFLLWNVLVAALFAFVIEPVMIWLRVYQLVHWNNAYSFPIYVLIAIFSRWAVLRIQKIMQQHRN